MRYFFAFIAAAVFCVPHVALAHATPIETVPRSGETLARFETEVRIRFSERLEEKVSRIIVTDEQGVVMTAAEATVDEVDPRTLSVALQMPERNAEGAYFVKWSVVSADDGHFTKGAYAYFIGEGKTATSVPQVEIVQSSALPEATAMAVELVGNGLLWGVLVLFALLLRPIMRKAKDASQRGMLRFYRYLGILGVLLVVVGACVHAYLKSGELAALSEISFMDALLLYLSTVSGSATVARAALGVVIGALIVLRARAITSAVRITKSELLILAGLVAFAYFRAKVSHATANPFFPELSVLINVLHLVGKDLWAGLLAALSALYLYRPLRPLFDETLRKALLPIMACFALTGTTASYIVWLHLKGFGNLTSTLWGERFSLLLMCGVIAALLLVTHALLYRFRPSVLSRRLPVLLASELVAGVLIVFFSSLMIITSPPHRGNMVEVSAKSEGLTISLSAAPYEEGMARIAVTGGALAAAPVVRVDGSEEGGLLVDLAPRSEGEYVFPLSLLTPSQAHRVKVQAPQVGAYDAMASFIVTREELAGTDEEGKRRFDFFEFAMLVAGFSCAALAVVLYRLIKGVPQVAIETRSVALFFVGIAAAAILMSQLIEAGGFMLRNEYKAECLADGNTWHLMLPMRAGVPTSEEPAEGCMALGGSFHIADASEYRYLKTPSPSRADFGTSVENLHAGVPAVLSFSIKRDDGTAPLLSVAHERLVHIIIVSSDMQEFYHVHPDDAVPLSAEDVRTASFSVPFTFARGGEYLVAVDYVDGLLAQSRNVRVSVEGPAQPQDDRLYPQRATFEGYEIELDAGLLRANMPSTLLYRVRQGGDDVVDLEPYLGAAAHVAVVRNDLEAFVHTHGEVHDPNATPLPRTHASAHQHALPPSRFGPVIEAHPVFPSAGLYTLFVQFMHDGGVIEARFTVRVEE